MKKRNIDSIPTKEKVKKAGDVLQTRIFLTILKKLYKTFHGTEFIAQTFDPEVFQKHLVNLLYQALEDQNASNYLVNFLNDFLAFPMVEGEVSSEDVRDFLKLVQYNLEEYKAANYYERPSFISDTENYLEERLKKDSLDVIRETQITKVQLLCVLFSLPYFAGKTEFLTKIYQDDFIELKDTLHLEGKEIPLIKKFFFCESNLGKSFYFSASGEKLKNANGEIIRRLKRFNVGDFPLLKQIKKDGSTLVLNTALEPFVGESEYVSDILKTILDGVYAIVGESDYSYLVSLEKDGLLVVKVGDAPYLLNKSKNGKKKQNPLGHLELLVPQNTYEGELGFEVNSIQFLKKLGRRKIVNFTAFDSKNGFFDTFTFDCDGTNVKEKLSGRGEDLEILGLETVGKFRYGVAKVTGKTVVADGESEFAYVSQRKVLFDKNYEFLRNDGKAIFQIELVELGNGKVDYFYLNGDKENPISKNKLKEILENHESF